MAMVFVLQVMGAALVIFGLLHALQPKLLGWTWMKLRYLGPLSAVMITLHTRSVGVALAAIGLITAIGAKDLLVVDSLSRAVLVIGILVFVFRWFAEIVWLRPVASGHPRWSAMHKIALVGWLVPPLTYGAALVVAQ